MALTPCSLIDKARCLTYHAPPGENDRRLVARESSLMNIMASVVAEFGSATGAMYDIQLHVQVKCHRSNILISSSVMPINMDLSDDTLTNHMADIPAWTLQALP